MSHTAQPTHDEDGLEAGDQLPRSLRPRSQRSQASKRSRQSQHSEISEESTPLLSRDDDDRDYGNAPVNGEASTPGAASLSSVGSKDGKGGRRWPTIVALSLLSVVVLAILGLGFAAPAVVEEYAKEAVVFEPTDLSIDSFTSLGVRTRIKGNFMLDASRVQRKSIRDLGRAGTWIARAVESKESRVAVYLPEYGNVLLGTAAIPPMVIDIRNGHTTHIDFLADLVPGNIEGIRNIANEWLDGRLKALRVLAAVDLSLKSGIFSLGTQRISESRLLEGQDLPVIPQYNITKLKIHEVELPGIQKAMAADVSLTLTNEYPIVFTIPPLGFDILVSNCLPDQPYILLADATTAKTTVEPRSDVCVNVSGVVRNLPDTLTTICPNTHSSPLDSLLGSYIHGKETMIFVRGSNAPSPDTPDWIAEITKSIIVPIPFPGHTFDNLIRDFSLTNVHFGLPNPLAEPDTPEAQASISAVVKAMIGLPDEMNFPIDVSRVRADADVFYRKKKLGLLDLKKWQTANSTKLEAHDDEKAGLAVEAIINNAPLEITDDNVFTEVVQALIFGGKGIVLGIKANVDVETETALGKFVIRDIPAEGKVFVKPISGGNLPGFSPKVGSLQILETRKSALVIKAMVNVTNPTEYSATIPYLNINLLSNGTLLGHATARGISVVPGPNQNIEVTAFWDPVSNSGEKGAHAGRELLSQYISGYNTTLTLKTHDGTVPAAPRLGHALSSISIEIPTPKLTPPKNPNHPDDDEDPDRDESAPRFIDDATFHLLTSTATFTLLSPLPHSTLYVTSIDATALYNHTQPIGAIVYDLPFAIPPGATTSPRLPVDWSLDSVGYEAVKLALGGRLKLDARAEVGIRIGMWSQTVWFEGRQIGARVKI